MSYWTIRIEYSEYNRNKWTPTEKTGAFSVLTRGVFRSRDEACIWASRELGPGSWMAVEVRPCPLCGEDTNHPTQHIGNRQHACNRVGAS